MAPSAIPPEISTALSKSLTAQTAIVKSTPALEHALTNSTARGLPSITISPAQGQQLSILCKMINAKRVLEIGTLGGYSTIWFAGINEGMHVTSIEVDATHRNIALEHIKAAGMEEKVDVILGAALDVLPQLAAKDDSQPFDFVFIDAAWDEQAQYFDWAVKLTRKGGVVYVDNAVRQLMESEEGDPTANALIEMVKGDERVEATLVPTLNTHKVSLGAMVDGYLIAVVL